MCATISGLVFSALLYTTLAPLHSATPGLPFTEDFTDDNLQDADRTRADWNTNLEQLGLLGSGPAAQSLSDTFDETSVVDREVGNYTTRGLALGDLNGNGHLDLVETGLGNNRVHLNDGNGNFTLVYSTPETGNTRAVAIGDVNRNGRLDFALVNFSGVARVYLNDGTGENFVMQPITDHELKGDALALVDLDGDGFLDVVIAAGGAGEPATNRIVFNTGNPSAPFGPEGSSGMVLGPDGEESRNVVVGDVDNDGDLDIIFLNGNAANRLHLNIDDAELCDEPRGFCVSSEHIGPENGQHTRAGALGDVNGNGLLDLVVVSFGDAEDSKIYFNQGNGPDLNPFTEPPVPFMAAAPGTRPLDMKLADINNNGMLDIVVALSAFPARNRIYFNDHDGTPGGNPAFASFVEVGAVSENTREYQTNVVVVGDVNGNGRNDLLFGNQAVQPDNDPRPNHLYLNAGVADGPEALQLSGVATSLRVDNDGSGVIESVRLTAETSAVGPRFHNHVDFWVSSDGGERWSPISADGRPINMANPGMDLRWRAFLRSYSPFEAGALAVDELTLSLNDVPVAMPDDYEVEQDTLEVSAPGVLENDTDGDGDTLTATLEEDVSHGTLTLNADGSFTYTPDAGFPGTDTFTYRASDGSLSAPATVTIRMDQPPASEGPVITLNGAATMTITQGGTFDDPGATATDEVDGDLTNQIEVDDPVDTGTPGTYTVTYTVENSAGASAQVERTVIVQAASSPTPPPASGGGGGGGGSGSFSGIDLLGLLLLALAMGFKRRWHLSSTH